MAKLSDLLRRVEAKLQDTFENADVIDWFNDCQNDLSDVLFLPTIAVISRDSNGKFILPSDYNDSLKTIYSDSKIIGNELIVKDDNVSEVQIEYNKLPKVIENNAEQIPDIPAHFHYLYVYFACKEAMLADEENERYVLFKTEYLEGKVKLKKYMATLKSNYLTGGKGGVGAWKVIR